MDTMGDADELYDDESFQPSEPVMTGHARVLTGAGLVLAGMFTTGLFQYLAFFLFQGSNGGRPEVQYTIFAGPTGVMSLVGGWLAWSARRSSDLSPAFRGLAVAAAVVGGLLALSVAVGIVIAFSADPDSF